MAVKYQFTPAIPVTFLKEGKYFIAYSPALDISTSATTFEKVKKRFAELVEIFFEELAEKGTLDRALSGLRWQKEAKEWIPPMLVAQELETFRVPLYN